MSEIEYPTRCKIVDPEAARIEIIPGYFAKAPEVSKPHIGKEGLAELMDDGTVRVTLDDGNVLLGSQCWWARVSPEAEKTDD